MALHVLQRFIRTSWICMYKAGLCVYGIAVRIESVRGTISMRTEQVCTHNCLMCVYVKLARTNRFYAYKPMKGGERNDGVKILWQHDRESFD